jgi:UDP-N-acetylenolpyruvoylglucosamine reductase
MKKLALTVAALSLFAIPAQAQVVATVNASARVEASLTAATSHQLKFGTLAMGASSTLASSGASQSALSGLTTAGLGQILVSHNSNVNVTATVPSVLTNSVSGTTLGFAATCATASTSGGTGTDTGGCGTFSFNAGTPGTVQSTYVLVGGTVTGSAAAGIGDFTGDIEFTFAAVN